jgi:hypothetical protein
MGVLLVAGVCAFVADPLSRRDAHLTTSKLGAARRALPLRRNPRSFSFAGLTDSFSFEERPGLPMRPANAESFGSDLLQWMDPLAGDVIAAAYVTLARDPAPRAAIVRCHSLMWRALLAGRSDAPTFRRELMRLTAAAKIAESAIESVDRMVMAELLDTVAARYSRSPREAGRLSFQVALIASWLGRFPPTRKESAPAGARAA